MELFKIINEGRKEDFISKYSRKYSPEQIDRIVSAITPKFLEWVGKHLDAIDFENNFISFNRTLDEFEKLSNNLPKTDLYQYGSLSEVASEIENYKNKERRNFEKVEGGNLIYNDDRFYIVNPLTYEASCYYGKGTKWCTAASTDSHFKTYNQDGKLFYIIDKTLPTSNKNYKVAILKKFDGDISYWNAIDDKITSGWIFGTETLNEILKLIDQYLESEYSEQIRIFKDKELAKKEMERLNKLRIQRENQEKMELAQDRRDDAEWELGPDCPEEGLKAHALLDWLVDTSDVGVKNNEVREEIQKIKDDILRLESEYNEDENVRTDLLDQISDLEDELDELESENIDVYNIVPVGSHSDMTEFEGIGNDNLVERRYVVGTEDQMQTTAVEYVDQLIDDVGYHKGFAKDYIDEQEVLRWARDMYSEDVYQNGEAYFNDDEKELSRSQEERIKILKSKIEKTEELISSIEETITGDNEEDDESAQENIDELEENIEQMNDEITEIEEDPDGDYPEELCEDKINNLVYDARRDIIGFMEEYGLEFEDYVDKDDYIQGVIDADGYGIVNGYDGNVDEVYVQNELFYVMRID